MNGYDPSKKTISKQADDRGRISVGSTYANQQVEAEIKWSADVEDLPVAFARHQLDVTWRGKARLYADRRIGIDWGVGPIVSEPAYRNIESRGALTDIRALRRFSKHGAVVFAVYHSRENNTDTASPGQPYPTLAGHALIGIIEPGTPIQPRPYPASNEHREEKFLKTVPLRGVVEVTSPEMETESSEESVADQTALFDVSNHPRGSVREWDTMAETVRRVYRHQRS